MSVNKKWSRGVFRVLHPSLNQLEFRNGGFPWEQKKARVPQGDMKIKIDACFVGKLLLKVITAEQSCWPGHQILASWHLEKNLVETTVQPFAVPIALIVLLWNKPSLNCSCWHFINLSSKWMNTFLFLFLQCPEGYPIFSCNQRGTFSPILFCICLDQLWGKC